MAYIFVFTTMIYLFIFEIVIFYYTVFRIDISYLKSNFKLLHEYPLAILHNIYLYTKSFTKLHIYVQYLFVKLYIL